MLVLRLIHAPDELQTIQIGDRMCLGRMLFWEILRLHNLVSSFSAPATKDVKPEVSPLAFAQSRRAAEKAWTAADERLNSISVV